MTQQITQVTSVTFSLAPRFCSTERDKLIKAGGTTKQTMRLPLACIKANLRASLGKLVVFWGLKLCFCVFFGVWGTGWWEDWCCFLGYQEFFWHQSYSPKGFCTKNLEAMLTTPIVSPGSWHGNLWMHKNPPWSLKRSLQKMAFRIPLWVLSWSPAKNIWPKKQRRNHWSLSSSHNHLLHARFASFCGHVFPFFSEKGWALLEIGGVFWEKTCFFVWDYQKLWRLLH